jgi:hypothetical protein
VWHFGINSRISSQRLRGNREMSGKFGINVAVQTQKQILRIRSLYLTFPLGSLKIKGYELNMTSQNKLMGCTMQYFNFSIQPLGRIWQEPEPSQSTGMALALFILGKFLRVVCHCFPLPFDVPTFAARCLHDPNNASAPVILPK